MPTRLWVPEAQRQVGAFFLEVGEHAWPSPAQTSLQPDTHLIALSLSKEPNGAQMCYDVDGQINHFVDTGDLFFFPANVLTIGRSEGGWHRIVRCSFDSKNLPESRFQNIDWELLKQVPSDFHLRDSAIRSAMTRIAKELLEPGFVSDELLEVLASGIVIDLARSIHSQLITKDDIKGGLSSKHLRLINARIESTSAIMPTLTELADMCDISVRHLMRAFKQTTGTTVHGVIESVRLKKAKQLLGYSQLPLTTIANQLGFKHPSSFSNAFRRELGVSPSEFRRQFIAAENKL